MSAEMRVRCDVPGCTEVKTASGVFGLVSVQAFRLRLKGEGWNSTRIANPFADGTRAWELKTVAVDRCPVHTKVRLRMIRIAESRYRIEIKG